MKDKEYNNAKKIVIKNQKASIPYLQRKLMISYFRASNILNTLEKEKIVSPKNRAKSRKILIKT